MIHSDRMDILLGRYAVGDASCLADPALVAKAQDYRRRAAARMMPLDPGQLAKKLPAAEYHVSLKIDGEFNVLAYAEGQAVLVNPGGTVRTGLPLRVNLLFLPLQLAVVFFHELPNLLSEIQQPLPLLDVQGHGHPLQSVNTDAAFFAHLAVQRSLLRLVGLFQ